MRYEGAVGYEFIKSHHCRNESIYAKGYLIRESKGYWVPTGNKEKYYEIYREKVSSTHERSYMD